MLVSDKDYFVFPEKGGISRDYVPLHNHQMTGINDPELMKDAVDLQASATHEGDALTVDVTLTNDKTGHSVPTDSPARSMMLVVEALDANGETLALSQGPLLPVWTGNYSGQPGKAYAKILRDDWSGETPTAAYWRPVTIVEDTRLAALASDHSTYTFSLPSGRTATVKIRLVYRRSFQQLAEQKGWNDPDIPMAETTIPIEK